MRANNFTSHISQFPGFAVTANSAQWEMRHDNMGIAVPANRLIEENRLVDEAVSWLRRELPENWRIQRSERQAPIPGQLVDSAIELQGPNGVYTAVAVEVRKTLDPRDVDIMLGGLANTIRALAGNIPILVVASWIGPRSRDLLSERRINYLDLTGNALIRLENPTLYLKSVGAGRDPAPALRGPARVRGPRAARLLRLLADVQPPYGVGELATAAQLAPGYVSRLLETLDREALVERGPRGVVEDLDVLQLIRRWAASYDIFKANAAGSYIAPAGARHATNLLAGQDYSRNVVVTGSFAANRLAPVAAPILLAVYCADVESVANTLGLLPADEGANVVLLKPFDPVVWERTTRESGIRYAAPTQVAVDCLSGNGRMPAEGEALLAWMAENESEWRLPSLADLGPDSNKGRDAWRF